MMGANVTECNKKVNATLPGARPREIRLRRRLDEGTYRDEQYVWA